MYIEALGAALAARYGSPEMEKVAFRRLGQAAGRALGAAARGAERVGMKNTSSRLAGWADKAQNAGAKAQRRFDAGYAFGPGSFRESPAAWLGGQSARVGRGISNTDAAVREMLRKRMAMFQQSNPKTHKFLSDMGHAVNDAAVDTFGTAVNWAERNPLLASSLAAAGSFGALKQITEKQASAHTQPSVQDVLNAWKAQG